MREPQVLQSINSKDHADWLIIWLGLVIFFSFFYFSHFQYLARMPSAVENSLARTRQNYCRHIFMIFNLTRGMVYSTRALRYGDLVLIVKKIWSHIGLLYSLGIRDLVKCPHRFVFFKAKSIIAFENNRRCHWTGNNQLGRVAGFIIILRGTWGNET